MTTKRILFATLCVLLVLVVVMFALILGKFSTLLDSLTSMGGGSNTPPPGTSQSAPSDSATDPTEPDPTEPDLTPPTFTECPHEYVLVDRIDATCDGYGWNVYKCNLCKHTNMPLEDRTDPLGHDFAASDWVDPTCTEPGFYKYACNRCHDSIDGEPSVDPLGHEYGDPVEVPANCGVDAHTAYPCTREGCTEALKENIQEGTATGDHTFGDWIPNEDLTEMTHTCEVCSFAETVPYEEQPDPPVVDPSEPLSITGSTTAVITGEHGSSYTVHTYTIGTAEEPVLYTCIIEDYSNNPTLTFTYDAETGPVLRFTDAAGIEQTYSLAQNTDLDITIDPTGNIVG